MRKFSAIDTEEFLATYRNGAQVSLTPVEQLTATVLFDTKGFTAAATGAAMRVNLTVEVAKFAPLIATTVYSGEVSLDVLDEAETFYAKTGVFSGNLGTAGGCGCGACSSVGSTSSAASGGAASGGFQEASYPGISEVLTYYFDAVEGRYEYTGDDRIDPVIFGSRWTITNLTYSFPTAGSLYGTSAPTGYAENHIAFNLAQQTSAIYALGQVGAYTNLSFTQITETNTEHATLRFSQTSATAVPTAQGMFPGSDPGDGDVWFGTTGNQPNYLTPAVGNWGNYTMMHEIGHVLGLKHAHDDYTTFDLTVGGYLDQPGPHYGTDRLPVMQSGHAWSVMSYYNDPHNNITLERYTYGLDYEIVQTFMQGDIAALQYLYGANFTTHATDSVYTFNATTGEMFINGVGQGAPSLNPATGIGKIYRTIWDGNGVDTYDLSNYSQNQSIDLRPGAFSTFSTPQVADTRGSSVVTLLAPGNIANALLFEGDVRSLIENAIGGAGHDKIVGNQANNTLTGNGGNDSLDGGAGTDSLIGGLGDDTYVLDTMDDVITELTGEGIETVKVSFNGYTLGADLEHLILAPSGSASVLTGTGNDLSNVIIGDRGFNFLYGLGGDDLIIADAGVTAASTTLDESALPTHNTVATSIVLTAAMFGLDENPNIYKSTTAAHTTITGTGNGTFDMYTITVDAAGVVGYFDIDFPSLNFDSWLDLFNASGTRIAYDDESDNGEGGEGSVTSTLYAGSTFNHDAFLSYTFMEAGTYYLRVGQYGSGFTPAALATGTSYTLHVTLDGNAVPTVTDTSGDGGLLSGGDGNDTLMGGYNRSTFEGGAGDDVMVGGTGSGRRVVTYANATSAVTVSLGLDGIAQNTGGAGIDTLYNMTELFGSSYGDSLTGSDGNDWIDSRGSGGGVDTMTGGLGDDTYAVRSTTDVIIELADGGTEFVIAYASYSLENTQVETLSLVSGNNDYAYGNELNNSINGNGSNNVIMGMGGNDSLYGADGDDVIFAGPSGTAFEDTVDGGQGNDHIYASGAGTYTGGTGNDTLSDAPSLGSYMAADGGEGIDTLDMLAFDRSFTLDMTTGVTGAAGYTYLNFENYIGGLGNETISGTAGDNILDGNSGNDSLSGGNGNDTLDGGGGNDTLNGGLGDDIFYVDSLTDVVTELNSQGTDTVLASVTYTLSATSRFVENLTLTGTAHIQATGNNLANRLVGNSGHNRLDGGSGNDTMSGGLGNDTYVVQSASDSVVELNGEGRDTVLTSVTYTLSAPSRFVEDATLTGTDNINITGNNLNNILTGNSGINILAGGLGNDTYFIQNITDNVLEANGEGTDTINATVTYTLAASGRFVENLTLTGTDNINATGNNLANRLVGNTGNNLLDGGLGNDTMTGGLGDDTYVVQSASDSLVELDGQGQDTVLTSITFSLATAAFVEHATLTGTADLNLTGNALNNILTGNSGINTLSGGLGNDTYVIQSAGDSVVELDGQGQDGIVTSISYSLAAAAFVEEASLAGTADLNLTGNALNNILTGNSGINTLSGGLGNDSYYIQNLTDNVLEATGEGTDTIHSTVTYTLAASGRFVENLALMGTANINATGNNLANVLTGNDGNNRLDAGRGTDTYTGGLGADIFVFGLISGQDVITDFNATQNDSIDVSAYTSGIANTGMVTQSGLNVLITLGGGNIITVNGANTGDVLMHMVW